MQSNPEERISELEAELAAARAEVAELTRIINAMGGAPQQNAAVEGADADAPEAA